MGLLIAYLLGLLTSVQKKNASASNSDPDPRRHNYHSLPDRPITVVSIPPTTTNQEKAEKKKQQTRETIKFWVEIIGLAVLAIYTGTTVATYIQIKNQFRADQRAWVVATVLSDDPSIGHPFEIILRLKNTGKTVAIDTRICTITEFVPKPFALPTLSECKDGDWRSPAIIPPVGEATLPSFVSPDGGSQNGLAPLPPILTGPQFESLVKPDVIPIHHGRISYTDIFGCHHSLTFCQIRRLTNGQGSWQLCNSETANNTDTGYDCN